MKIMIKHKNGFEVKLPMKFTVIVSNYGLGAEVLAVSFTSAFIFTILNAVWILTSAGGSISSRFLILKVLGWQTCLYMM